jgi:hypothetical protein
MPEPLYAVTAGKNAMNSNYCIVDQAAFSMRRAGISKSIHCDVCGNLRKLWVSRVSVDQANDSVFLEACVRTLGEG